MEVCIFNQPSDNLLDPKTLNFRQMHYPPETASIMLVARILASLIQRLDRGELKSQLMSFCHHTVNEDDAIAHKLLGKEFENQLELLRELTSKALGTPEVSEVI